MNVSNDYKGGFGYIGKGPTSDQWYEASVSYPGASGSIVIENNDLASKLIEGTFSGTAVNTDNAQDKKTVAGSFIVSYNK